MVALNACTTSIVDYTVFLLDPKTDEFLKPFYAPSSLRLNQSLHGPWQEIVVFQLICPCWMQETHLGKTTVDTFFLYPIILSLIKLIKTKSIIALTFFPLWHTALPRALLLQHINNANKNNIDKKNKTMKKNQNNYFVNILESELQLCSTFKPNQT